MNPAEAAQATDIPSPRPDSGPMESGVQGKAKKYEGIHTRLDVG